MGLLVSTHYGTECEYIILIEQINCPKQMWKVHMARGARWDARKNLHEQSYVKLVHRCTAFT